MKNSGFLAAFTVGLAVATGLTAQEAAPAAAPQTATRPDRTAIIKQFDRNGDGVLDEAERQAARETLGARTARKGTNTANAAPSSEPGRASAAELMRRFDTNGDGVIDDAERQAARQGAARNRPAAAASERPQIDRKALVKEFDQDGDGTLSDTERTAAMQAMRERMQRASAQGGQGRPVRAELIKRFDTNGDGILDEAERQAARESLAPKESEDAEKSQSIRAPAKSPGADTEPAPVRK